MTIERVAVIGTGVIGTGWVTLLLARGLSVVASDPARDAEARLRDEVERAWPVMERLGLSDTAARDLLEFTQLPAEAVEWADLVQECGPETLELKTPLIAELDEVALPGVPILSSSSGHMPSMLQAMARRHPERVLIGHPFNPVHVIPLVEVVPGRLTQTQLVERVVAFYASLGMRPVVVRGEVPGHLTNRLQAALWREAYSLVERGVASVTDIDTAISYGPGLRWALLGPLVNQHLSGGPGGLTHVLEHLGPPAQAWMDDLGAPQLTSQLAAQLVAGVNDELAEIDQHLMAAQRDELLVQLLQLKRQCSELP